MRARYRPLLVALAFVVLAPAPRAQGGYTTEKHPDLGLTFPRARDYEQVPTQPDEPQIVLHFIEKLPASNAQSAKSVRPELYVLWIDHVPDAPTAKTGGDTEAPPVPGDGPATTGKKEETPAKPAPPPPINTFERFVQQRLKEFKVSKPTDGKARQGWAAREYTMGPKKGGGVRGWACAYSKPERTVVFLGFASESDLEKHTKIWRTSADKVDFDDPEEMSTAKLEMRYARSKYSDIPFRINVRKKLVRGWQAQDLDDYIVVYDTADQPLMRKVFRDLDLIRKEYEKLFPPDNPITAVSTVRVCKNREEYLSYGGMEGSAGYFNPETQELVLYDAEKIERDWKKNDADTFIVLYHEAFHQYIYYCAGELPPHYWFNEGTGDYFSGAQLKDGKMRGIGVNPWRVGSIQYAIEQNLYFPLKDFVEYERKEYYAPDKRAICYAQGWSLIYFLRTSKLVASKPEWARILPTYFQMLKSAWAEEVAKLGEEKKGDDVARWQAGLAARKEALEVAFRGVDFDALEDAWRVYVLALPLPDRR